MTPGSSSQNKNQIERSRDSGIISAAESGHESETNTIKNFLAEE